MWYCVYLVLCLYNANRLLQWEHVRVRCYSIVRIASYHVSSESTNGN